MAPASDPGGPASAPSRTRRRVYATRGLVASVAVLALAVQAEQVEGVDDAPAGAGSGDQATSAPVDPAPADDA